MISKCHICMGPGEVVGEATLNCYRCGRYRATKDSFSHVRSKEACWGQSIIANASGWLCENQGSTLDQTLLDYLSALRSPPVATKAEKLLLHLAPNFPLPGDSIYEDIWAIDDVVKKATETSEDLFNLDSNVLSKCKRVLPFLSASWCQDQTELHYIIFKYLMGHKRYIVQGDRSGSIMITPAGWDYISTISQTTLNTREAFVAMWFDVGLNAIWASGISVGIAEAGYIPVRIDKHEHNNKIDDEIIAAIRRARFLVADFTGQRGGVYFEAGLATGLGKPVVWLCKRSELKDVHFDTRQYNFILWDLEHPNKLANDIQNRIEATIGRAMSA